MAAASIASPVATMSTSVNIANFLPRPARASNATARHQPRSRDCVSEIEIHMSKQLRSTHPV
jgi:hypothetical protein